MPKNVFAGVGFSENNNPFEAGNEVILTAIEDMKKKVEKSLYLV